MQEIIDAMEAKGWKCISRDHVYISDGAPSSGPSEVESATFERDGKVAAFMKDEGNEFVLGNGSKEFAEELTSLVEPD